LYIDDALVIDNWGVHAEKMSSTRIKLSPGSHKLNLFYENQVFGASAKLLWGESTEKLVPIPPVYLAPGSSDLRR
jgi:hypothetical protein